MQQKMDLEYAINQVKTISECEVGTIRKEAVNRVLEELEKLLRT